MPHRGKTDYPAKAIAQPLLARNAPHKKGEAGSINGPGFAAMISEAVIARPGKPDRPCRLGSARFGRIGRIGRIG